jgi:hypothetical protein
MISSYKVEATAMEIAISILIVGFLLGYGVRASISHHRHALARRGRLVAGL